MSRRELGDIVKLPLMVVKYVDHRGFPSRLGGDFGTLAPSIVTAGYDRKSIQEKTKAGQQLAAAQNKHIDRPKGLDAEKLTKVRKALEKGSSVAETVELAGISLSSVKDYRRHLNGAFWSRNGKQRQGHSGCYASPS